MNAEAGDRESVHREPLRWPAGTTALPNALFDALLPTLSDTELRVLLVVARSTLGWREGNGRKERDWLSHAQLCRRTGRSNTPVSSAIDSLVQRGLLLVQNEAGEPLTTPAQRRAARSRLFFRLGPALLAPPPTAETAGPKDHRFATRHKTAAVLEAALPDERAPDHPDIPQSGFHLPETTKETRTKNLESELSFPQSGITDKTAGIEERDDQQEMENEEAVRRVLHAFERAYRTTRPAEPMPPGDDEAALALLQSYVERGYAKALEAWLPAFFSSSFGFVRRRNYSLHAYLDCFFVLQSRGARWGTAALRPLARSEPSAAKPASNVASRH